jgi:hypothetical protein
LKAPLVEIYKGDSKRYYPREFGPLGDGVLVELHIDHTVSIGEVYFDIQPHFPCFALFLDSSNSLVLKPTGRGGDEYIRVGIAKFLRPDIQLPTDLLGWMKIHKAENVRWGPITNTDMRVFVTIV